MSLVNDELKIELAPIVELSNEDLPMLGFLAENEALLTRRMTRAEFEELYGKPR
jgi:hypothetical protein